MENIIQIECRSRFRKILVGLVHTLGRLNAGFHLNRFFLVQNSETEAHRRVRRSTLGALGVLFDEKMCTRGPGVPGRIRKEMSRL